MEKDKIKEENNIILNKENNFDKIEEKSGINEIKIIVEFLNKSRERGAFELNEGSDIFNALNIIQSTAPTDNNGVKLIEENILFIIKSLYISFKRGVFTFEEGFKINKACSLFLAK